MVVKYFLKYGILYMESSLKIERVDKDDMVLEYVGIKQNRTEFNAIKCNKTQ
jgi:hypothetical protein